MSRDTEMFLMVAAFVVPFALIIWFFVNFKKRRRAAYETFAARHNLDYQHSSWPMLSGTIDGRPFMMGLDRLRYGSTGRVQRGAAARSAAMLVAGLGLNNVPEGLVVVRRGLIEKAMTSDVTTNDPVFDKKALVRCPNPNAAMAYLTPERRAMLVELVSKKISLQNGELSFGPGSGKLHKLEHLEKMAQPFFDAGPVLDGDTESNAGAGAQTMAAAAGAPATEYSGDAYGGTTSAAESGINPVIVAGWMAGTALILLYLPSWAAGYFQIWFTVPLVVRVAIAAAIGFFAVMSPLDLSKPVGGAAVGVATWLGSSLVTSLFYFNVVAAIASWFSTWGIFQIILAAASGAGMAFLFGRREEGMDL